ncbi:glycosyl transferase family 2 [Nitrospirillum amazonense]|uniref:Glycosyl transferase family 2 n=1 Tax=Nitrospirillum amazonense TaxID=28077 RepID=A0A560JM26_9PROT|nr:glycosyl transferase family 2 [Nitrospirillum amazonense]MDG3438847.1 hypothetical protein [Nitrospirillum amazonense]TWB69350.1 hypothetical protein FBZ87_109191 [Nitrospirillum amazonense]
MKSELFVSAGIVVNRPIPSLKDELAAVQRTLNALYSDYEILVIIQGPVLQQVSDAQAADILSNIPCIRFIQLSFAVPSDVARSAIVENAIGDFVLLFDLAADPLELIAEAVAACQRGSDIIVGVSILAPSPLYRLGRRIASPLLASIDYQLPANATDFRCVSRRAINAVINTGRSHHQLNLRLQKTGYPSQAIAYEQKAEARRDRSLPQACRQFLHLLVFNSSRPLRWMSGIGLLGSLIALIFACYSVLINILKEKVMEGWTTTVLFMSIQFMLLFLILAFISEYLGRLLDERRGIAEYAVVSERNSRTMVNDQRVNVLTDSV